MAPRGHTMLGSGRTVQGEKLVEYELVLIREQDGQLAYQAHPSGQPSAVFPSRTIGEREIEGPRNGQTRRVEFPYKRVACP